jgi:hypothetical protein
MDSILQGQGIEGIHELLRDFQHIFTLGVPLKENHCKFFYKNIKNVF